MLCISKQSYQLIYITDVSKPSNIEMDIILKHRLGSITDFYYNNKCDGEAFTIIISVILRLLL